MKYLILLLLLSTSCSCNHMYKESFDPELARMYWDDKTQCQEQVKNFLRGGMYEAADSFVRYMDAADSAIVDYYRKCGLGADYHGTEFINVGHDIWFEIPTSSPSPKHYSKKDSL